MGILKFLTFLKSFPTDSYKFNYFIFFLILISIFIGIGLFVYYLWNNLITCSIISILMLTISILIYLYEFIVYYKKKLTRDVDKVKDNIKKLENFLTSYLEVSGGSRNFITVVDAAKICGVILFTVFYILSIYASATSFSPGRDLDIKPFSIVKTIFIYILTICSIIFINFAVGREITNKTIPHFLIKVLTYTLLTFIALSCTDDNIFKISNILNLISSSIMLFIVIIILIYMFTKIKFPNVANFALSLLDMFRLLGK